MDISLSLDSVCILLFVIATILETLVLDYVKWVEIEYEQELTGNSSTHCRSVSLRARFSVVGASWKDQVDL
jgi:hypothetical protein